MKKIILLLVTILGLTACGGGGSADTQTPQGTSVNLSTFKAAYLGTSNSVQYNFPALFGSDSQGRAWSGSLSVISDGATTFEGQSVTKRRSLLTLQLAGGTPVSVTTTAYCYASDGSPYKAISSTGVTYTPTSQGIIPSTAKVGDFGTLSTISGSDGTTTTATWSLNAGANGASILAISSVIKTGATVTGTEVDSYFLDAAGLPTRLSISVTTNGLTVSLSGAKS